MGTRPHHLIDGLRDGDAPRLGQRAHARGDVDPFADDLSLAAQHVTQMDADAHAKIRVALERTLQREGTVHGAERAGEDRQRLVAGGIHHLAVKLTDQCLNEFPVLLADTNRRGLVALGERGVAHHVGKHDGQELALVRSLRHDAILDHPTALPGNRDPAGRARPAQRCHPRGAPRVEPLDTP